MSWLNNMKVGKKLVWSFSAVSAIAVIVGVTGIVSLRSAYLKADTMYNKELVAIKNVQETNIDLLYAVRAEKNFLLVQTPDLKGRYRYEYKKDIALIHENLEKTSQLIYTERGRKAMAMVLDAFRQWQESSEDVFDMSAKGKEAEAVALSIGEARRNVNALEYQLDVLIKVKVENARNLADEIQRDYEASLAFMTLLVIGGASLSILLGTLLSRSITLPLVRVTDILGALEKSNKSNAALAEAIASGDLDREVTHVEFPNIGKVEQRDDEMGRLLEIINGMCGVQASVDEAISQMAVTLRTNRDRERSQDWFKGGINELNTIVRGDRPLEALTGDAITFLSTYLKAGVSALYLFEEGTGTLRIIANYAFTRRKNLNDTIRLGEGLAGEAARERKPICLKNIPPDYLAIGSALGEAVPRAVLALPLLHDNRLIAVMELGTFNEFNDLEVEFLNQSAEVLAIAVSVNLTRQRVNELLQQSQSQEEELRVQQEELQQSNEELEERAQLLEQQREQIQAKNREMEEAGREIMRKAKELEQVSTYKSEFLANMSHELRTPLNSLMILSGHLKENREGNLTPKQVEYSATIESAGKDLLNLINDILDLSKIESGRLEFVYEEAHPVELCDQLTSTFKPLADQKGVAFTTAIEEGVSESIRIDPQRTLQVLKNLLSNAVKFTAQGSVALSIYTPQKGENPLPVPAVAFRVTDTGIGIPAAKHELIFQAFQQADGSTSRKFGGTGLGLSISRQLARGMKGEILIASEEGKGSSFTLYLPLSAPGTPASSPATAPPQKAPAPGPLTAPATVPPPLPDDRDRLAVGERCILIIEDDLSFAKLLMEVVRERGFAAVVATDGISGVALAESLLPSAIILDVMLPGMDGWGVMQKLTDNLRTRHIPVHFITCLEERQKALAMGAIGFVTKPVTREQLDAVFGTIEDAVSRTLRKLLIVEDDKAQAAALVALLEERDISIEVAETGAQAIELLMSEPFDCIVLDLGLSDMSGFDLLDHIHKLDESRRIPVIIHTGQELSSEDSQRLQRYAESIIIKGARSPERLLNEVTLFLHVTEGALPPDKQRMIRTALDTETLLAGKRVLIVDDDMRNIFSLSSVLAAKGMLIVEAENGKEALAMLEEHPDVNIVLMDIMMPEMDGYEATRLIRQDPRFARLPIIALTAKAMKGDREACLKAGASDYITKPIDMERLLSLLRVWLYNE